MLKGSRNNKFAELARRFAPDLAATIERNLRRSRATSKITRLRSGQGWCKDVMPKCEVIVARVLSSPCGL